MSFYSKYYGQLKGLTIVKAGTHVRDGEEWPYFTVRVPNVAGPHIDVEIEVSRDEEGNGPGFLFGLPRPEGK